MKTHVENERTPRGVTHRGGSRSSSPFEAPSSGAHPTDWTRDHAHLVVSPAFDIAPSTQRAAHPAGAGPIVTRRPPSIDRSQVLKATVDAVLALLATPLALIALGELRPTAEGAGAIVVAMGVLLLAKGIGYFGLHVEQRSWATVTFIDMLALAGVAVTSIVVGSALQPVLASRVGLPPALPLVDGLITLALLGGVRAFARYRFEAVLGGSAEPAGRRRVLVVGAGQAGTMAVKELLRHPETGMVPVGFLDDDRSKRHLRYSGLRVLGALSDARRIVSEHNVNDVLIAMPSDTSGAARRVVDLVKDCKPGLSYKIVPGMYEVLSGKVDVHRIRDVEITDLLGRKPVRLDVAAILGYLEGKRVLVTGAGGSIGSELVRQICRFHPAELILFGHGENSIYALERELDRDWPHIAYHGVIGAIQNGDRLDSVFARYRPDVVFHAAAHKHVPLMEQNPEEAVLTTSWAPATSSTGPQVPTYRTS